MANLPIVARQIYRSAFGSIGEWPLIATELKLTSLIGLRNRWARRIRPAYLTIPDGAPTARIMGALQYLLASIERMAAAFCRRNGRSEQSAENSHAGIVN